MSMKAKTPSDALTSRGGKARQDRQSVSVSYSTRARFVCRGQLTFLFDSSLPNPQDIKRFHNQRTDIINYLLDGKTLTQDIARYLFGVMRLASRVCELRQAGWNIYKQMIFIGEGGARVARYWLDTSCPRVEALHA